MLNIFPNRDTIDQSIEYLTDFQSFIKEKRIKLVYSKLIRSNHQEKDELFPNEETCPRYSYRLRIINRNPLIIYIENFLSKNEIDHLIKLA